MTVVRFLDVGRMNALRRDALLAAITRVLDSGWYVLGEEVERFEADFAAYCGVSHAVGVGNGLDALTLALRGLIELGRLQVGDEVMVPANTYIATILAVSENRLKPVLVEPDPRTFAPMPEEWERAITERTRVILPVHLYGRIACTPELVALADRCGLVILEDAAQAHGASLCGSRAGSLGLAAGFSFYPGKNLGALGDAGAVTTDDDELADVVRTLANYGSRRKYVNLLKGRNSRLDELQAAVLSAKLPHLDGENERRRKISEAYRSGIDNPLIVLPESGPREAHAWHLFVVRCDHRAAFQEHLSSNGVEALIHYPVAPHRQEAYGEWHDRSYPLTEEIHRTVVSLPMDPTMTDAEVERVIGACNAFKRPPAD